MDWCPVQIDVFQGQGIASITNFPAICARQGYKLKKLVERLTGDADAELRDPAGGRLSHSLRTCMDRQVFGD